jgi:hypothetical protein
MQSEFTYVTALANEMGCDPDSATAAEYFRQQHVLIKNRNETFKMANPLLFFCFYLLGSSFLRMAVPRVP